MALAFGGTVTTDADTISSPTCTAIPFDVSEKDVVESIETLPNDTPPPAIPESFVGDCDVDGSATSSIGEENNCDIISTEIPKPISLTSVHNENNNENNNEKPSPSSEPDTSERIIKKIKTVKTTTPSLVSPRISISKEANRLTPLPFGGGNVKYTYTVTNPGTIPMHDVSVTDDKCRSVFFVAGDTNDDDMLATNEVWTYACRTKVSVSTRNVAIAEGKANGFTVQDNDSATVLVSTPGLPKTGLSPEE